MNTVLLLTLVGRSILAADAAEKPAMPELWPVPLTAEEKSTEKRDWGRYPLFMKAVQELRMGERSTPSDPRNHAHILTSTVFFPDKQDWKRLFQAAAAEHLTLLRAFSIFARSVKQTGTVVYGPGPAFEEAIRENHANLGLAMPAKNVGASIWTPDPHHPDPEFQARIKVFYTHSYVHEFPDEIIPANLKIGLGEEQEYWLGGERFTHPTVQADVYYGPKSGIGIRNVKGIGGQKRGFLGFIQNILFFLPDAVHAMVIREEKDELHTEALVNTVIRNFETTPKYAIRTIE